MFKQKSEPERRSTRPTQQANVFSYYQNRSTPEASRGRYEAPATHRTGFDRLQHVPTVIALVVIIVCVFYASLLNTTPRVLVTATESGKGLQQADSVYASFVESELQKSVGNRSKLTFDGSAAINALRKQYPEVSTAIITIPILGHKPVVRIAVSSPAFILATPSGAFYVSDRGVPLVRVNDVQTPLENIPTVTDQSNVPVTVGKQILPQDTVAFIQGVLQQLAATKTSFDTVTLPLEANELQVQLTDVSYYARFNTLEDPRTQVGTLRAVQNRLISTGEQPMSYIDLRVAERAYYK